MHLDEWVCLQNNVLELLRSLLLKNFGLLIWWVLNSTYLLLRLNGNLCFNTSICNSCYDDSFKLFKRVYIPIYCRTMSVCIYSYIHTYQYVYIYTHTDIFYLYGEYIIRISSSTNIYIYIHTYIYNLWKKWPPAAVPGIAPVLGPILSIFYCSFRLPRAPSREGGSGRTLWPLFHFSCPF